MNRLNTRAAIVTGAAKGIGAAIAKALAADGAAVVVNYQRDAEAAEKVVADITANGGRAVAIRADVTRDAPELVERARAAFGRIDVLVNNAGVATFGPLTDVTQEQFQRELGINLYGPIATTQAVAGQPDLDGASIINVSTGGTFSLPAFAALYVASKSALNAFTVVAARELGPRGIRVNAIAPGPTATEGNVSNGWVGSDLETASIASTPLGRTGRPDDYGPIATFLASDEARWITGDVLLASGGQR